MIYQSKEFPGQGAWQCLGNRPPNHIIPLTGPFKSADLPPLPPAELSCFSSAVLAHWTAFSSIIYSGKNNTGRDEGLINSKLDRKMTTIIWFGLTFFFTS